MPGLITHYICGHTVLSGLDNEQQTIIKKHINAFNIGTQGPDFIFYYVPGMIPKNTRGLGQLMHNENVGLFISNLLQEANKVKNKLEREVAFSYVSGYLTHYALDANTHPYIYYNVGFALKGKPYSLKNGLNHRKFENSIDHLLLEVTRSSEAAQEKIWRLIKTDEHKTDVITRLLSNAIYKTYGRRVSQRTLFVALSSMTYVNKFMELKNAGSKKLLTLIDNSDLDEDKIEELTKIQKNLGEIDYLNINNKIWHSPWDLNDEHTSSFTEMYNVSLVESSEMITAFYLYLKQKANLDEVMSLVKNRSLKHGADCDDDIEFKYHNIIFNT